MHVVRHMHTLQDATTDGYGGIYKQSTTFAVNPTRLAILDAAVDLAAKKGIFFEVWAVGAVSYSAVAPGSSLLAT